MRLRILAIESSSERCSVALWRNGEVSARSSDAGVAHSEVVLPFVGELLNEADLNLRDLDAVAFGAGPGGFTGLRLACGVAQGLAFGAGLPVIGIGSLEALAWGSGAGRVYTCLDARMEEVYCACFIRSDDALKAIVSPGVFPPHQAPLPCGADWFGIGNGFSAYPDVLSVRFGGRMSAVSPSASPHALAVAELAVRRFQRGQRDDPCAAIPMYVRDKVASTTAERLARGGKA